jgi:hypothetical protein
MKTGIHGRRWKLLLEKEHYSRPHWKGGRGLCYTGGALHNKRLKPAVKSPSRLVCLERLKFARWIKLAGRKANLVLHTDWVFRKVCALWSIHLSLKVNVHLSKTRNLLGDSLKVML